VIEHDLKTYCVRAEHVLQSARELSFCL